MKVEAKEKPASPGSLNPKLAKALGEMAEHFSKSGQAAYSEIMNDVKQAVSRKLVQHKGALMSALREEFGQRGIAQAEEHTDGWMEGLVADLMNNGFEPLVEALKKMHSAEDKAEAAVQNRAAKVLALAFRAHKKGKKTVARDLFTFAADDKSSENVAEELEKMAGDVGYETFPSPGEGVPEQHSGEKEFLNQASEVPKNDMKAWENQALTPKQQAKARSLANKIAAAGHRDIARKVLAAIGN